MGRDGVGDGVIVGEAVSVGNAVLVMVGVAVIVDVGVAALRLSRLKVRKEPASTTKITPATPPAIHGSQSIFLLFFLTTSLKSDGTEIKTTVVLSCPPRELARSISARAASFTFALVRMVSRISSFHTRSVRPSLHMSTTSSGRS